MNKDRLKPYVFKVEGAVNFALYDMLNGKYYQFSPYGSIEELRKILFEKKLNTKNSKATMSYVLN